MDASRKFFDVARPGQAAPSATSRPVISRPLTPDPMFSAKQAAAVASAPNTEPKQLLQPAQRPAKEQTLDPAALLIQAGNWRPPKASGSSARRAGLIAMAVMLVVMCAASYWLVSTM